MDDIFNIPSSDNQFIGRRVRVTMLRDWQKLRRGQTFTGILTGTMAVNGGRTLIGTVKAQDRIGAEQPLPWSRNFVQVDIELDDLEDYQPETVRDDGESAEPSGSLQRLQWKMTDADRQGALFVECMTDNQRQLSMFGGE